MDSVFHHFCSLARDNEDVAIETSQGAISYSRLYQRSLAYAEWLSRQPQQRVAIACSTMSINAIAMMLAVLANRKSCFLIDSNRSPELNHQLLLAAACELVLDEQVLGELCSISQSQNFEVEKVNPGTEGYVITTSGSTGKPKVILGSHSGLLHFISWQKRQFFESKRRVAQVTNCTFDVIYREVLTTLLSGSALVIPERDLKYLPGNEVKQWLNTHKIDTIHMVPSVSNLWMKTADFDSDRPLLKTVFFAGEKLHQATVENLLKHCEVETLVNLYGPSETTLAKMYFAFSPHDIRQLEEISVGYPLPDTEVDIDKSGQVWIHTLYPSLGYIQGSPFVERNGKTWYPTGDIGALIDGRLFLEGRVDDQIKVNGVRVHLNEINLHLNGVKGVIESCIVQNASGRLCGFYTGNVIESEVINSLAQKVRKEVLPSSLFSLSTMPTTSTGKIDRKGLIEIANKHNEQNASGDVLYDAWRTVTGYCGDITEEDNVFELGGDSLDIVCFAVELTQKSGTKVEYWDVYEHSTMRALRQYINRRPKEKSKSFKLQEEALSSYPMSPQQTRYKNIYIPFSNGNWCNMLAVWQFERVNQTQLASALTLVVKRHDALRSFYLDGQMHVVNIQEPEQIQIKHLECEDSSFELVLENERVAAAETTIDIKQWPLFTMTIVESEKQQSVIWNVHHLICDGFSQGIIRSELEKQLKGEKLDQTPLPYSQYAIRKPGPTLASEKYWHGVYQKPYRKVDLPVRQTEVKARGSETATGLGSRLTIKLKDVAKDIGCTPFSILLSTYFLCLHELCDSDDIVAGTPALGRMTKSEEIMVGNFISLVTMRSDLNSLDAQRRQTYLSYVHKSIYMAMKHQDYQYDELVRSQGYELEQDRFPLTTFFISMLDSRYEESPIMMGQYRHRDMGSNVKFDMMLYVDAYMDQFVLRSQYRYSLFTHNDQESFLKLYLRKLNDLLEGDMVCALY